MRARSSLVLAFLLLAGCRAEREPEVWLVHATDPHLFEEPKDRDPAEKLNAQAFEAFLRSVRSLPGVGQPKALVITGDFGIAEDQEAKKEGAPSQPAAGGGTSSATTTTTSPPASGATPPGGTPGKPAPNSREDRIARLAALLSASPIHDVYFVPGNNDIKGEEADEASLREAATFFDEVEAKTSGKVALHNLTSCYLKDTPLTGCYADLGGTSFRLIGFPSSSFKATKSGQAAQLDRLATLLAQAAANDRKALIVTHIAEMDDPYKVAKALEGLPSGRPPDQPQLSAWGVSADLSKRWKDLMSSGPVAGVLAGHFHDSHRVIYQRPYRWAGRSQARANPAQVLLAPPLAIRFQGDSPVQARGFSLIGLAGDRLEGPRLFWYDLARNVFEPQRPEVHPRGWGLDLPEAVRWLWRVGGEKADLARAVIVAIAFLLAFLTVVALWEIPPPDPKLANPNPAGQNPAPPPAGNNTFFLPSNLGKTVLTGLSGVLAVELLSDKFWSDAGFDSKAYYVLMFILFFVGLLVFWSLLRGLVEALRSRTALWLPPVPWPPRRPGQSWLGHHLSYWSRRLWRWIASFRSTLLVFLDTSFSLFWGKNQTQTEAYEKTITDLHWSLVTTADRVREAIKSAVLHALNPRPDLGDVRVGISVLSDDGESLYYVSSERGSLFKSFPKNSVAWVAVSAGEARWWRKEYKGRPEIILFENGKEELRGLGKNLRLIDYYDERSQDYEAFVVLPLPWSNRGGAYFHRGGIHVSFKRAALLDQLWATLPSVPPNAASPAPDLIDFYQDWRGLLDADPNSPIHILKEELRAVLLESMEVLTEVLRYFNQRVFEERIKPLRRP